MALDVTYYAGSTLNGQIYGEMLTRAVVTLTGSSASLGAPPSNAVFARLTAGEACVVSNNNAAVSSTNGQRLDTGGIIDLPLIGGNALRGMTA